MTLVPATSPRTPPASAPAAGPLDAELRLALARHELVLHYQPVVDVRLGRVIGVEALVRWQHPSGLRLPDDFIPAAEASGLVVEIGESLLEQACAQAAAWARAGLELVTGVNLSARQVCHPHLVDAVEGALARSGLPPHLLLVELTETTVVEDAELALSALTRLAKLGVGIAIDDFGTGYSSLLYLKRYPITALKVDRSFVAGAGAHADDHAIVSSIIGLAHAVGAACIAEGVETVAQHAALQALGCDMAQGFLFSPAVPAADVPAAVRACADLLTATPPVRRRGPEHPPVDPHLLARIVELDRAGDSRHTIAAALNAGGARQANGRRWHSTSVARALSEAPADTAPVAGGRA